jgi:hypothetical protein
LAFGGGYLTGSETQGPAFRQVAERALALVDRLQVRLAEAVAHTAFWIAAAVVILIFVGLFLPVTSALPIFKENSSIIVRSVGLIASFIVDVLILGVLGFGSLIVANLTFRWIDRVASPR